jgi:methyltransferase (TIGR00027 family)
MTARDSSTTMIITAIQRAAHQVLDDEPRILDDPIAIGLAEGCSREEILAAAQDYRTPMIALLRSAFVLRSRFVEDCLQSAVTGGIRQYVILGAGLDTFAYRQPDWARNLAIFEVDHPSSQEYKRERLAARGIEIPASLRFCPCDFEHQFLEEALAATSFDCRMPAFFSWLGVTQYLTRDAIETTLRFVASLPHASEITFQFVIPQAYLSGIDAEVSLFAADRAAMRGEPWITRIDPEECKVWLASLGFSKVFHLTPEEAQRRYFEGRRDGLRVYRVSEMMDAVV